MKEDEKQNLLAEIEQLKMLVIFMHGDWELPDYWQDMANKIMAEDREREEKERREEEEE